MSNLAKRDASIALAEADERLLAKGQEIAEDMMAFVDINLAEFPDDESPPREWVAELGMKRAQQRLRICRMAMLSRRDAPIGLTAALQMRDAIVARRAPPQVNNLNIQMVQIAPADAEPPVYEVIDEEPG